MKESARITFQVGLFLIGVGLVFLFFGSVEPLVEGVGMLGLAWYFQSRR